MRHLLPFIFLILASPHPEHTTQYKCIANGITCVQLEMHGSQQVIWNGDHVETDTTHLVDQHPLSEYR